MKKQKGITLVALIITIIVMLILVGVTVTTSINGGLFENAKEAVKKTTLETEKEQLTMAIVTAYDVNKGEIVKSKLQSSLDESWELGESGEKYVVTTPNNIFTINKSDRTIIAQEKPKPGTIAALYCEKENCTEEEHLHKGDYVKYSPEGVATYNPDENKTVGANTGYSTAQEIQQENLNWRVLGKDDHGNILLISGAPTTQGLVLSGYIGYNNGIDVLNNTCNALYGNTILNATARSINMDDINTYLGGYNYTKNLTTSTTDGYYGYKNAENIESKYVYDKDSKLLSEGDNTIPAGTLTSERYYYYPITDPDITSIELNLLMGNEEEKTYYYYIATRYLGVESDRCFWCYGGVGGGAVVSNGSPSVSSEGNSSPIAFCLRPIVELPGSLKSTEVTKSEITKTETWNDPLGMYIEYE